MTKTRWKTGSICWTREGWWRPYSH